MISSWEKRAWKFFPEVSKKLFLSCDILKRFSLLYSMGETGARISAFFVNVVCNRQI